MTIRVGPPQRCTAFIRQPPRLEAAFATPYMMAIGESAELTLSALTRILGDSPLKLLIKLLVVSFLVGLVMSTFGWSPWDVFYGIQDFFVGLYNMGFRAFDRIGGYILLGAAIVVPAYIILRILNFRR